MNNILLILSGIFVFIIIFLMFILMSYLYDTYTNYKININNNLIKSEKQINETSFAFNNLQDIIVKDVTHVNNSILNMSNAINSEIINLNSNITNIFEISSNNVRYNDLYSSNVSSSDINLNLNNDVSTWSSLTMHTDSSSKYFNICDNNTNLSDQVCVTMNIDDSGIFNFYSSNKNNSKKINGINIYNDSNVLVSFNTSNNSISLGSNINPAIFIKDNIYTPQIINVQFSILIPVPATPTLTNLLLQYISNFDIPANTYINFIINTTQQFKVQSPYQYTNNILKLRTSTLITKSTLNNLQIPITLTSGQAFTYQTGSSSAYISSS
jgi:hypothetical protein